MSNFAPTAMIVPLGLPLPQRGSMTRALSDRAADELERQGKDVNEFSVRARARAIQDQEYVAYHVPGPYRTLMPNGDGTVTPICVGCWWCTP